MIDLIDHIKTTLTAPLPGEDTYFSHPKYDREKELQKALLDQTNPPKLSATLLLLYKKKDVPHFVLIERNKYPGAHSGQISFPGGKTELQDSSLEFTALRETHEEIGVPTDLPRPIGKLSEVYVPVSNFIIHPFIAFTNKELTFVKNDHEVNSIIEVPLNLFLSDDIIKKGSVNISSSTKIRVPYYDIYGHTVWGATALILSEFKKIINVL